MEEPRVTICENLESIISTIDFPQDIIQEGESIRCRVYNVTETRNASGTLITANCLRSDSSRDYPYVITFSIDPSSRHILSACCSCIDGIDGMCKHGHAVLSNVNLERSEGKQMSLPKPKEETALDQTSGSTRERPLEDDLKSLEEDFDRLQLDSTGPSGDQATNVNVSPLPIKSEEVKHISSHHSEVIRQMLMNSDNTIHSNVSINKLSSEEKEFYDSHIKITDSESCKLCEQTMGQSSSPLWFQAKKLRITASKAHKIDRARSDSTRIKYCLQASFDNESMRYGREMEPIARHCYEQETSFTTYDCGIVIKPSQPWLGASPDGIVLNTQGEVFLLEIKCPSSRRDTTLHDLPYLNKNQLKVGCEYYTQVQIQMYVCNVKKCHLFIYSSRDHKIIDVIRDDAYLSKVIHNLESIYFKEFLQVFMTLK